MRQTCSTSGPASLIPFVRRADRRSGSASFDGWSATAKANVTSTVIRAARDTAVDEAFIAVLAASPVQRRFVADGTLTERALPACSGSACSLHSDCRLERPAFRSGRSAERRRRSLRSGVAPAKQASSDRSSRLSVEASRGLMTRLPIPNPKSEASRWCRFAATGHEARRSSLNL